MTALDFTPLKTSSKGKLPLFHLKRFPLKMLNWFYVRSLASIVPIYESILEDSAMAGTVYYSLFIVSIAGKCTG